MYASDVITGSREGRDLNMIERYIGTAIELTSLSTPLQFLTRFPEASRALSYVGMPAKLATQRIHDLYMRHATDVREVLQRLVASRSKEIVHRMYPANCLLSIAVGQSLQTSSHPGTLPRSGAETSGASASLLIVDRDTFCVRYAGRELPLGNTREFALLERLAHKPKHFVSYSDLSDDVWGRDDVETNTIQRTVSNLRRKLRQSGMESIIIDGRTRGHYALRLAEAKKHDISA
jgi:DNA-binding response OmpR family regulator